MAISLYDVSVVSFLQGLGGIAGFMDIGLAYCKDNDIDPGEIAEARLHPTMEPFRFQVVSAAHHSIRAIEDVKRGLYLPPSKTSSLDYTGLQKLVADASDALQQVTVAEVNALEGRDMILSAGDLNFPFTVEGFLMSISIPNFHFHATTAYNILRAKGIPIGKLDYMGKMRLKT